MHTIHMLHQKFVVIADTASDELLEIFYDTSLPGMHIEIFGAAEKKWKKKGKTVYCKGGGMVAFIDQYAVFYARSGHFGRYTDSDVYVLSSDLNEVTSRKLKVLSKAGEPDPFAVIRMLGDK